MHKSTPVVSSLRFATLCVILDSISCMIYLKMRILFSDHVIFLTKQTNFFIILTSSTLTFLLHSFCLPLYGCALWHLDFKAITNIDVAFRRQIWNLHFDSH